MAIPLSHSELMFELAAGRVRSSSAPSRKIRVVERFAGPENVPVALATTVRAAAWRSSPAVGRALHKPERS
jgi:hypothetical protein